MGLLGEFESILPGEKKQLPDVYLKGIDRSVILQIASFLLGFNSSSSPFIDWRNFLGMWFRKENLAFAEQIADNCARLERKYQTHVSLYYNIAAFRLFEFALSLPETETTQSPAESEINLFKAYAYFLTRSTEQQITNAEFLHAQQDHSAAILTMFNIHFGVADLENYDLDEVIACQMVKGTALFQFMEASPKWIPLLQKFYDHFRIKHWTEYFQGTIPLIKGILRKAKEGTLDFNVAVDEHYESSMFFLKKLAQQQYTGAEIPDFIRLRGKPLYQIDNNTFRVISDLFLADKIYKSLFFELKVLNDSLPPGQQIKELRGDYGEEFTEQSLLYQVLDFIYGQRKYVRLSGSEITKKFKVAGGPDYYLRNGNHLFLYENKDTFVPGSIKTSGDIEKILTDLKLKLYYKTNENGKISPKAVQQLTSNIERALLKQNKFDTDYKEKNLQIYPILVLHDACYNAPGFNQIINDWFKIELKKLNDKGINTDRVKPITYIHIDTLILYGEYFKQKKESLNDLIVAFHRSQKVGNKQFSSLSEAQDFLGSKNISFGKFLDFHTNLGYKQIGHGLVGQTTKQIFESQQEVTDKLQT